MAEGTIFKFHNDLDTDQIICIPVSALTKSGRDERAHIRVS